MDTKPTMIQRLNALIKDKSLASPAAQLPSMEEMQTRGQQLEQVRLDLNSEFAGLEEQIKTIFGYLKPWWLLPQAQRRPLVISLWGMTGVGKSSFVLKLVEKLQMNGRFAQVDLSKMGTNDTGAIYSDVLPMTFHRHAGGPCILFLDEFHRARTINEQGHEVTRGPLSDFLTLMDTGLVANSTDDLRRMLLYFHRDRKTLRDNPELAANGGVGFLDESTLDNLAVVLGLDADGVELSMIAAEDPAGFLEWLMANLTKIVRQSTPRDFRQALIFVAGNLDEAFVDAGAVNPDDLNAEDLHQRSSRVSVDLIKQCLLSRFRPEQVSRLGSMQVIFPSLSRASFEKLIRGRLKDLSQWVQEAFKAILEFDPSVTQLILQEGVVASQGARPVLTTLTDLIECKLPTWLLAASGRGSNSLSVGYDKTKQIMFLKDGATMLYQEELVLRDQRLPDVNLSEAVRHVIAVHEAAHAVVGIVRQGRLPIKILSGALSWHRGGPRVVFDQIPVVTRELGQQLLEVKLAGMVGEQLMFGKNHHSTGCSDDLQTATESCAQMISLLGMGPHIGVSLNDQGRPANLITLKPEDDALVETWLRQARQRATAALNAQLPLFEALTRELMVAERLTVGDLQRLVSEHYRGSKKEIAAIFDRKEPRALERLRPKAARLRRVS